MPVAPRQQPLYAPTVQDVLQAFATAVDEGPDRPLGSGDLSLKIAVALQLPWPPDRPSPVSQHKLREILEQLVAQGTVQMMTGSQWKAQGVQFLDCNDRRLYHGRIADAARWLRDAAQIADAAVRASAQGAALLVLRDRHPEEYAQIVEQEYAKRTRAQ